MISCSLRNWNVQKIRDSLAAFLRHLIELIDCFRGFIHEKSKRWVILSRVMMWETVCDPRRCVILLIPLSSVCRATKLMLRRKTVDIECRLKLISHVSPWHWISKICLRMFSSISHQIQALLRLPKKIIRVVKNNGRRGEENFFSAVISLNLFELYKHNKWNETAVTSRGTKNAEGRDQSQCWGKVTICERIMCGHPSNAVSAMRHGRKFVAKPWILRWRKKLNKFLLVLKTIILYLRIGWRCETILRAFEDWKTFLCAL